jgi:hypothetical protein
MTTRENEMNYVTGKEISTAEVLFKTARGAEIKLILVRNAELGVNGYLKSGLHAVELHINGSLSVFGGAKNDKDHGFCLLAGGMGRTIIPVTAAQQNAVKALLAERDANNTAAYAAASKAENEYRAHEAKIDAAMTLNGRTY